MSTVWNFEAEEVKSSLDEAVNKAAGLISAADEKVQEIESAKSSMEDAQSDLEEAVHTLGMLPEILDKYDRAIDDMDSAEVYY